MKNWDEIKIFLKVAQLGTVSAASQTLDMHRATIIRHLDSLEQELGEKLFLRHPKGYTLTELGSELKVVAESSENSLNQFVTVLNSKKNQLTGDLIITGLETFSFLVMPAVSAFRQEYPDVKVKLESDYRVYQLEYGEAHIAIRPGKKPTEPDYVVQPAYDFRVGMFASDEYIRKFGIPGTLNDFEHHSFVAIDRVEPKTLFEAWFMKYVPKSSVKVWVNNPNDADKAILNGTGIGFFPLDTSHHHPSLKEVWPRQKNWSVKLWMVTHVDQHRLPKVQAFLRLMKQHLGYAKFE